MCHLQITFAHRKTRVVSRADPARLLEAAKKMYNDAWEFTTNLWNKLEDAPPKDEKTAWLEDPGNWKEVFDPTTHVPYWFNEKTSEWLPRAFLPVVQFC